MSKVKVSARFIEENAEHVFVDKARCAEVAKKISSRMKKQKYTQHTWSTHRLNPSSSEPKVIDWIFTVDTLNFSFWQDEPRFMVRYLGQEWTGYWSMVAAINRALEENIAITSPKLWTDPKFNEIFKYVFRSDSQGEIPLFDQRLQVLKEAGLVLLNLNYDTFEQILAEVGNSSLRLVNWLVVNIPSYNDVAQYKGREVQFYKRAQILAADLWACGVAQFTDISELTMFADYRVPQILAVLRCIWYSPNLEKKIQAKDLLPSGSQEDVEIRGCSILSVELIVDAMRSFEGQETSEINSVLVDFYLWDTAKEQENVNTEKIECHRSRSLYY